MRGHLQCGKQRDGEQEVAESIHDDLQSLAQVLVVDLVKDPAWGGFLSKTTTSSR